MPQEIFIILGSPNSPSGKLSTISLGRLNHCLINYKKRDLIICTGGWGSHFNTAEQSHAYYAKKFLIEKGIPENAFLDFALSSNTVDDAVKSKSILDNLSPYIITVITSDYHLKRVELIFKQILKMYNINFVGVISDLPKNEFDTLLKHETKSIQNIIENGLYY